MILLEVKSDSNVNGYKINSCPWECWHCCSLRDSGYAAWGILAKTNLSTSIAKVVVCPRGTGAGRKQLHIKETLGDISQLWKYKGRNVGICSRLMIMTIHQGKRKRSLHNVAYTTKKASTVPTVLDKSLTKKWNTFSIFLTFKYSALNISCIIFSFPYIFMTDSKDIFNVLTKIFKDR